MARFVFPVSNIDELKENYDLIVIGSGAAGMTAAIQAQELGLKVAILEKLAKLGGNSNRASTGMNATETMTQLSHQVIDNQASFYEDIWQGGGKTNNKELLKYFVTHSESAINWLEKHNIFLTDLTSTGGMSQKRAHRPDNKSAVGSYMVKELQKQLLDKHIPLFSETKAMQIVKKDGIVTGLKIYNNKIGEKTIKTKTILIASGGFSQNKSMLKNYAPELLPLKTTNHPGATGDGLNLAVAAGGGLVDMDKIQVHPTTQQDTDHVYLIGEGVRGEGAILVNQAGQRFVNEMTTRDKVTMAIDNLHENGATLIFDQGVRQAFPAIDFYQSIGLVMAANSLSELAKKAHLDSENLTATVVKWNANQISGKDSEFGRKTGMDCGMNLSPYYAIHIKPAIHYTMGGIKINNLTEVLSDTGEKISGLYAAGEVTGGLHGDNRMGGNSITETIIFGRQAGVQAAKYIFNY